MKKTVEQRFWEKVGPHDDPTKCWLWTGATHGDKQNKLRYGSFRVGRMVQAHRFSYEMYYHTTIPEGMIIDHVEARGCTSTLCVNPHHLEVVTNKVNLLRGDTLAAKNVKVMCCPKGHPYSEENTYVYHGGRYCRVCYRERQRIRRALTHNKESGKLGQD